MTSMDFEKRKMIRLKAVIGGYNEKKHKIEDRRLSDCLSYGF